jgi:hypothetical protein
MPTFKIRINETQITWLSEKTGKPLAPRHYSPKSPTVIEADNPIEALEIFVNQEVARWSANNKLAKLEYTGMISQKEGGKIVDCWGSPYFPLTWKA